MSQGDGKENSSQVLVDDSQVVVDRVIEEVRSDGENTNKIVLQWNITGYEQNM